MVSNFGRRTPPKPASLDYEVGGEINCVKCITAHNQRTGNGLCEFVLVRLSHTIVLHIAHQLRRIFQAEFSQNDAAVRADRFDAQAELLRNLPHGRT